MPPREWRLRVEDMLEGVQAIERYVAKLTYEEFSKDRKTVDAVVRNLQVIGEAARHVPTSVRREFPRVPWNEIVGMRSILVHEYFGVDLEILWATVREDIPALAPDLERILRGKEGA